MEAGNTILSGFLRKQDPKQLVAVWKRRFFKLDASTLRYFKTRSSLQASGVIPLFAVETVAPHPKDDRCLMLTLKATTRTILLQADTTEACEVSRMAGWVC